MEQFIIFDEQAELNKKTEKTSMEEEYYAVADKRRELSKFFKIPAEGGWLSSCVRRVAQKMSVKPRLSEKIVNGKGTGRMQKKYPESFWKAFFHMAAARDLPRHILKLIRKDAPCTVSAAKIPLLMPINQGASSASSEKEKEMLTIAIPDTVSVSTPAEKQSESVIASNVQQTVIQLEKKVKILSDELAKVSRDYKRLAQSVFPDAGWGPQQVEATVDDTYKKYRFSNTALPDSFVELFLDETDDGDRTISALTVNMETGVDISFGNQKWYCPDGVTITCKGTFEKYLLLGAMWHILKAHGWIK